MLKVKELLAKLTQAVYALDVKTSRSLTTNFNTGPAATRANMLAWLNSGVKFASPSGNGVWEIKAANGLGLGVAVVSCLNNDYTGMIVTSYYNTITGLYRYNSGTWTFSAMPTS